MKVFKHFFLTELGINFLNVFYKTALKNPNVIAVCAYENDEMLGFALGNYKAKGFYRELLFKNIHYYMFQFLKLLILKPKALIRLYKNLNIKHFINDFGDYSELLSIGVLPTFSGKGIGKKLLINFESEAIKAGCREIALTTDYYHNEDVIEFYKKSGYKIFYDFVTYPNRRMYKMIKTINL